MGGSSALNKHNIYRIYKCCSQLATQVVAQLLSGRADRSVDRSNGAETHRRAWQHHNAPPSVWRHKLAFAQPDWASPSWLQSLPSRRRRTVLERQCDVFAGGRILFTAVAFRNLSKVGDKLSGCPVPDELRIAGVVRCSLLELFELRIAGVVRCSLQGYWMRSLAGVVRCSLLYRLDAFVGWSCSLLSAGVV